MGFQGGASGKESACQGRRLWFDPWFGKIPWSREWQPTPLFLPGEFQGQRSLVDYSPWGHKGSDMTKHSPESESGSVVSDSANPRTIRGILQARIVEWVAFPFSRGSSPPRDWIQVSRIADRFFTRWATKEGRAYTCTYIKKVYIYI